MRTKPRAKKQKQMHRKPEKPMKGSVKYLFNELCSTGDRYHYFHDEERDDEERGEDEDPRESGQVISLSEVDRHLSDQGISRENVFFTAAFSDDYLCLQIMEIRPMSYKDQLKDYEDDLKRWDSQQKENDKREAERIEREMKSLQQQAERLKKKNA